MPQCRDSGSLLHAGRRATSVRTELPVCDLPQSRSQTSALATPSTTYVPPQAQRNVRGSMDERSMLSRARAAASAFVARTSSRVRF